MMWNYSLRCHRNATFHFNCAFAAFTCCLVPVHARCFDGEQWTMGPYHCRYSLRKGSLHNVCLAVFCFSFQFRILLFNFFFYICISQTKTLTKSAPLNRWLAYMGTHMHTRARRHNKRDCSASPPPQSEIDDNKFILSEHNCQFNKGIFSI